MNTHRSFNKWIVRSFIAALGMLVILLAMFIPALTASLPDNDDSSVADNLAAINANKVLLIPAADFKGDYNNHPLYSDGYISSIGTATACLTAPIYLSRNAIITQMTAFVYDNDVSDLTITLMRKNYGNTSSAESVASITTSGANTNVQSKSADSLNLAVTDFYTFYVVSCLGATTNHRLYAIRIFYTE